MDALLLELLTDLKAAARLGHPEALETALDAVRALAESDLPPTALVPLGRALELAPASVLRPLQTDPDPAVRALAAVGLAGHYLLGKNATPEDLLIPADDPTAPDVIDDAVDELIEIVLAKGGRVIFVDNGALAIHQRVALILRY